MQPSGPPDKAALRTRLRAARRARTPQQRSRDAAALARAALAEPVLTGLGPGAVVAAHASTPSEPGTGPLRAALAARGVVVLLPVVPVLPGPLGWTADGDPVPAGQDPGGLHSTGLRSTGLHSTGLGAADVVLLPALAVDLSGTRLGQGGGHYDRTLALLPAAGGAGGRPLLVAVVHAEEVLAAGALPREAHDAPVDAALTPAGLVPLGGRGHRWTRPGTTAEHDGTRP